MACCKVTRPAWAISALLIATTGEPIGATPRTRLPVTMMSASA
jgi:hypothetical protein